MPELVAWDESDSANRVEKWRRDLSLADEVTIGRSAKSSDLVTDWDLQISRKHAQLSWDAGGKLRVKRLLETRNPIYFQGVEKDDFLVGANEQFVIGRTTFVLLGERESTSASESAPQPAIEEFTCSREELEAIPFVDAADRLEVLAALPAVIRHSVSDLELESRVLEVLLQGIRSADTAAIIRLQMHGQSWSDNSRIIEHHFKARGKQSARSHISKRLVQDAVMRRRQPVLHLTGSKPSGDSEYTAVVNSDWVLCAPLPDEPEPGWALYLTGQLDRGPLGLLPPNELLLKSDMKFAELVADIFGALRQSLGLQRREALLARFLSRPVLAAIAEKSIEEVLKPRQATVTVLFCDLRGSCHIAEEGQEDLEALWQRVNAALSIMASNIVKQDGVIGDFQGDAAMGFWGWPYPHENQVERAARAALNIWRDFTQAAAQSHNPLFGFACGLGIAHGLAIAGRLGAEDLFKVDVFGPTVNLAARLESMTKVFGVPILMDEANAKALGKSDSTGWSRRRRLVRVKPFGLSRPEMVYELMPPAVEAQALREQSRLDYEAALDSFLNGKWADAHRLLGRMPSHDNPSQFLLDYLDRHNRTPPADWKGVIEMDSK